MNNNEWITDHYPYSGEEYIYNAEGKVIPAKKRRSGDPWKPIPKCEPYVKPKRYRIDKNWSGYTVYDTVTHQLFADHIYSQDAAERIAAIYEEVTP